MIPIICQDKATERPTSQAVGIGATDIPITNASSYFNAGERAFISEPDATEVEYLGTIQAADADSITVEFATAAAKGSGAKVWVPDKIFEWPAGKEVRVRRVHDSGVEVVRSLGGKAYATRLRTAVEVEHVTFENVTDERRTELTDFFDQAADGGLDAFTYMDAARAVWQVRLDAPTLEWRRTARDLLAVEFRLQLLDPAVYA